MKQQNKKMISFELPDDLREALRLRAYKDDLSISKLIRKLLRESLREELKEVTESESQR